MDKYANFIKLYNNHEEKELLINISAISQMYIRTIQKPNGGYYDAHYYMKLNNEDKYEIEETEYKKIKKLLDITKIS